ncbi:MAG: hypothetical protein A2Y07_07470 [Planctomycetes bacterium GWF2_50_10]|nr:MAG: hypothetical protein A2Y07_07470 [Planctomycetes bacterium GWF2_50_10]
MTGGWRFNKQLNLGIVVQLVLLASLILGSWVNLQRQVDILQHDVRLLLESQKAWQGKMDTLNDRCVGYEYRLRSVELLSKSTN